MTLLIDINTFNALKDATGDDFIGELIDTFLADAPELIQQMRDALSSGDAETFRRAAHSMKSNSATFGAMKLSALAKEMEMMARENNMNMADRVNAIEQAFLQAAAELQTLR